MLDTHHVRRIKLFRDTKTDKYYKLLLSFNDESKRHINSYKTKFAEAKQRKINLELIMSQELQRRFRETRDSSQSRHERDSSGGGSRVRANLPRDMTPGKNSGKG
jgi:hypothetical protein